jgi:hypothetical protein
MTCCNNNCNQGRNCPAKKYDELDYSTPFAILWVLVLLVCAIALVVIINTDSKWIMEFIK